MLWEYGKAFVVGGLICLVGQILIDKTKLTPARILVLFVTLGCGADRCGGFTARWWILPEQEPRCL